MFPVSRLQMYVCRWQSMRLNGGVEHFQNHGKDSKFVFLFLSRFYLHSTLSPHAIPYTTRDAANSPIINMLNH